jgi:hypothetical protein
VVLLHAVVLRLVVEEDKKYRDSLTIQEVIILLRSNYEKANHISQYIALPFGS